MAKFNEFTTDDLQLECVGKDWLEEAIEPFVANGCSILLSYHGSCGYWVYAKGNIPVRAPAYRRITVICLLIYLSAIALLLIALIIIALVIV